MSEVNEAYNAWANQLEAAKKHRDQLGNYHYETGILWAGDRIAYLEQRLEELQNAHTLLYGDGVLGLARQRNEALDKLSDLTALLEGVMPHIQRGESGKHYYLSLVAGEVIYFTPEAHAALAEILENGERE
jgi:hypothetical protein